MIDDSMNSGGDPVPAPRPGRREGPPVRLVRYGAMSWVGEFSCKGSVSPGWGSRVVIQTERGIELGEHIGPTCSLGDCPDVADAVQTYVQNCGQEFCRPKAGRILRVATEQDLNEQRHLNAHTREDVDACVEAAQRLGLGLKVVTAEHLLGGERIVFYFRSEARIDFRQLVKELAQRFRTRIEMRQVGSRDEARLVADYEICGRECCCRNFLKRLRPVNMKMAKLQKSTLDPSKVSGRCSKLRCCLRYEHLTYEEMAARLPRTGTRVGTDQGNGTVTDRQILTQLVMVRLDDDRLVAIPLEEIRAFNVPPPPPRPETDAGPGARPGRPGSADRSGSGDRAGSRARGPGRREREMRVQTRPTRSGPPDPGKEEGQVEASRFRAEPPAPAPQATGQPSTGAAEPPGAGPTDAPAGGDVPGSSPSRRRRRRRRRRSPGSPPTDGPPTPQSSPAPGAPPPP